MAGIPVVCAVGAPSSLAIAAAQEFGVTLLGFVRGQRFNVYTGQERLAPAVAKGSLPMRQEIRDGFSATIGNTPLIRLRRASDETGCEILGKAEFLNPGGSVKDRAARGILDDAERRGLIAAGRHAGRGHGRQHRHRLRAPLQCARLPCVIVMPDNQSPEKAALLRTLGAEVRVVKTVPYADPNHYQKLAPRVAAELEGAVCGNQFDNTANRDAHYATTGPEIWRETRGRVDAFTCATGTGGTLGGVSRYLKEQKPARAHRAGRPDGQRAATTG